MWSSPFQGPSSIAATVAAPADASDATASTGSCRVCDTVVLVCLACASCLIVATVAVCLRRAFANGYAAASSAGAVANGSGRRGLGPSASAAIPKLTYRRGCVAAAVVGWAQCAICLAVVRDGEVVRLLSACGHLFHIECIDLWLLSHAMCPQCQRDVGETATEKV